RHIVLLAALSLSSLPMSALAQADKPAEAVKPPVGPGDAKPAVNVPPTEPLGPNDQVQLSFQNAQIDMIVQWLAKTTGKSVVKHPRVNVQLTIVGSKGLSQREQVNLVYRALALEGFTAVETSNSILIVPEGSEPKGTPQFLD